MDLDLGGRTVVVTGGSGGIGSEICRVFAAEGAGVVVGYFRGQDAAAAVVDEIHTAGGRGLAVRCDVRDYRAVGELFDSAGAHFGGVDILVNCAGVAHFEPFPEYPETEWDAVVDTNLKGAFLCSRAAVSHFERRGGGDIVNISSLAAATGSFEGGAYAASKAGLNSLTLSLALELADRNIRVNAVAPGRIETRFRRAQSGPYFDFMLQQTPLKRMGTTREVANAAAFLASRASAFITGETLFVTGGLHTVHLAHVEPDPGSMLSLGVSVDHEGGCAEGQR